MEERTLSDIICDNTIIEKVQERALEIPHPLSNPIKVCQRHLDNSHADVVAAAPEAITSSPPIEETTQNLQSIRLTQQRVPKSLGHPNFPFDPNFNFDSLRPRHSNAFQAKHQQSIFEAFRKLQTREFHRIANTSNIKPVKFLERFDHSDAIILNP